MIALVGIVFALLWLGRLLGAVLRSLRALRRRRRTYWRRVGRHAAWRRHKRWWRSLRRR